VVPPLAEDGANVRAVGADRLPGQSPPLPVVATRLLREEVAALVVMIGKRPPQPVVATFPHLVAVLMAHPPGRPSENLRRPQRKVQVMENTGQAHSSAPGPSWWIV
jgi:hypothetical protein